MPELFYMKKASYFLENQIKACKKVFILMNFDKNDKTDQTIDQNLKGTW